MRSFAAASLLLARLLSSPSSALVAASFGGAATRNSRPEEITQVFQVPAFDSIRSSAACAAAKTETSMIALVARHPASARRNANWDRLADASQSAPVQRQADRACDHLRRPSRNRH